MKYLSKHRYTRVLVLISALGAFTAGCYATIHRYTIIPNSRLTKSSSQVYFILRENQFHQRNVDSILTEEKYPRADYLFYDLSVSYPYRDTLLSWAAPLTGTTISLSLPENLKDSVQIVWESYAEYIYPDLHRTSISPIVIHEDFKSPFTIDITYRYELHHQAGIDTVTEQTTLSCVRKGKKDWLIMDILDGY